MREIIAHFLVVCRDEFCKGFEPLPGGQKISEMP